MTSLYPVDRFHQVQSAELQSPGSRSSTAPMESIGVGPAGVGSDDTGRRRRRSRVLPPTLVTIGCFAVLEVALRLASFEFSPYTHYDKANWGPFPEAGIHADYLPDAELFWRFIPSHELGKFFGPGGRINRFGFRGPEIEVAKDPTRRRIAALGDSGTFGWAVAEADSYPRQLEQILNSEPGSPPVEVINAGVPGYTSLQGLRWFESHVARFSPDLIVISFGGNDADSLEVADKDRHFLPATMTLQRVLLMTRVYQLVYRIVAVRKYAPAYADKRLWVPRVSLDDFAANINRMIDLATDRRIRVLLLARRGGPHEESYLDVLREISRSRGVPYLDEGIDGHPPPQVYRRIAQQVATEIRGHRFLDPPLP